MNLLHEVLQETLRRLELGDCGLEARAVMLWPEIVGPQAARATEARSMQGSSLLVAVRSSVWSQELSFQKGLILGRFRARLGKEFVRDLRFVVDTVRGVVEPGGDPGPPLEQVRRISLPAAERERIREAAESADPELSQAVRRAMTLEAQLRAWHLRHGARECARCGAAFRGGRDRCPACRRDEALDRSQAL